MRLRSSAITIGAIVALTLTACGGNDAAEDSADTAATPSASSTPTPSESTSSEASPTPSEAAGTIIEVTIKDGEVTPAGARIEAAVGEPITFVVTSDIPGEMHVHSTPEHSIEFEPGDSEHSITIDRPGVVEVELHDPAVLVAQLEVR